MDTQQSNRNLNDLHPKVKELAEALIAACKKEGINVGISETYRTVERQDYLYSLGRTRSGNIVTNAKGSAMSSYHQWRLAFDVYNNVKGNEYNEAILKKVGTIGQKLGLEWGGAWTGFKDTPHFQYTFGLSIADLKNGKTPPTYNTTESSTTNTASTTTQPNIDTEYEKAVKTLVQKGIVVSPEAWYPKPNTKYVEALIENAMKPLMEEVSYEYHIKILQLLGIINTPEVWLKKEFKEEYIKILIKKIADILNA